MRLAHCTLAAAVVAACVLVTAVQAQYLIVDSVLSSSLEADGLHVHIDLDSYSWDAVPWPQTPDGVDVYRRVVGVECGAAERITTEPIPWSWNTQVNYPDPNMSFDFVDATTTQGTAYKYELTAVDADRVALAQDPQVVAGYATHGEALLGHGWIWRGPDCGLSYTQEFVPCPEECFPFALANTSPEVDQYGTQNLLLYGTVASVMRGFCNDNVLVLRFTRAVPSECVVGVEQTTWSAAKRLYR